MKEIIQNNQTYRQINCYELCYQKHIDSLVREQNISEFEARNKENNFDQRKMCDHLCALECDKVYYDTSDIIETSINKITIDKWSKVNLNDSKTYKKENLIILEEFKELHDFKLENKVNISFAK